MSEAWGPAGHPQAGRPLLIIQERDVGLFSMVWQVLHTLHLLEEWQVDRAPVALWGRALAYFHPDGHEGRRSAPFELADDRAAALLERHVRPRAHVRDAVTARYDDHLRGHHVIGVHVRGTDALADPYRKPEIPFERYFAVVEDRMDAVGRPSCRVFLATDEERVVARFVERFGDALVVNEAVRSPEGAASLGAGPTGQPMPGFIASDREIARRNGEDAVVEYLLLCRSDLLVHNRSSLSDAARVRVPEAVTV